MTMSAPSRQTDFSEILESFRPSLSEVPRVRTSAAPTPKAAASKAKGLGSTSKPSASSENAALVGSLLKTALISELKALTPCSLHWKHSATPAGRSWFVLQTSAPITNDPDHGSSDAISRKLPTPMTMDGMRDGAGGGSGATYPFRMIISTPRASDMKAGGHGDTGRMGTVRHMLATPRKTDADRGFRGDIRAQLDGQNNRHAGMLPTPRKSDASHGPEMTKVRGEKSTGMNLRTVLHPAAQTAMLHTPTKAGNMHHPSMEKWPSCEGWSAIANPEKLPTPTKRDKRMDAWSPAYDKRKSPTMDAVMDGALTDRASDKWVYARTIAAILTNHGLSGASTTLPLVYGWMMGFPPGWLERALLSAVQEGLLPPPSSSKPTATPLSRKSRKRSDARSSASSEQ